MAFTLPRLTTDIDCEPFGYPGLTVTYWLNFEPSGWSPPEDPQPWDTNFYHGLSWVIERVQVPAKYHDGDDDLVLDVPDAETFYHLIEEQLPYDFQILLVRLTERFHGEIRERRWQAELKN